MEISDPGYHLKLIEMCDCYLETDFPNQIQKMVATPSDDLEEDAMKYLALAILYAVTEKAQKLTFKRKKEKITITITVEGEKLSLKAPSRELFDKIIGITRTILHLDEDKGSLPLSLGLRNGQLELQVKTERKDDKETLKFKLPKF